MGNKLYVGNLPYSIRDHDLAQAFLQFGSVVNAKVMMERDTGRSKGFGFVEMASEREASSAISAMNGQPLGGRSLVVNAARPMEPRSSRFSPHHTNTEQSIAGYAGRNEGGFRSPYGTGPRGRSNGYSATSDGNNRYRGE